MSVNLGRGHLRDNYILSGVPTHGWYCSQHFWSLFSCYFCQPICRPVCQGWRYCRTTSHAILL